MLIVGKPILCPNFFPSTTIPLKLYLLPKKSFTTSAKFFIKKECEKVNYNVNIYTFMRVLKSYTEVFDSNIITREEIIDKNKCS